MTPPTGRKRARRRAYSPELDINRPSTSSDIGKIAKREISAIDLILTQHNDLSEETPSNAGDVDFLAADDGFEQGNEIDFDDESLDPSVIIPKAKLKKSRSRAKPRGQEQDVEFCLNPTTEPASAYLTFSEHWNPLYLYRLPSDIVLDRIRRSGSEGVGRVELGQDLMMDASTKAGGRRVTPIITNVCTDKRALIGQFQKTEGKIRTIRYFWAAANAPDKFVELYNKFEKFAGIPCPFKMGDAVKFPGTSLSTLRITDVSLRRIIDLLDLVNKYHVIPTINRALKEMEDRDKACGYNFSIDKKSLMKCIKALEQKKLMSVFETNVLSDGNVSSIYVVCKPEIKSASDEEVTLAIARIIDEYNKEGRVFPHGQLKTKKLKPGETYEEPIMERTDVLPPDKLQELCNPDREISIMERFSIYRNMAARVNISLKKKDVNTEDLETSIDETMATVEQADDSIAPLEQEELNETIASQHEGDSRLNISLAEAGDVGELSHVLKPSNAKRMMRVMREMVESFGYQSKVLRWIVLHEMAFQMVYGHPPSTSPTLREKFPYDLHFSHWPDRKVESLKVYVDEEGPLRFVPPIVPYKGAQRGWFMLQDFVFALPLSILMLSAYVPKSVPRDLLVEYLLDPIKRHICVGDLPAEIRIPLLKDKKLYRQIDCHLSLLCALGLMATLRNPDPKRFVSVQTNMYFVGKTGCLYDTSTSARGYSTVALPLSQYDFYEYSFDSLDDLYQYWHHVRAVVYSTPLSFRNDLNSEEGGAGKHKKYSQGLVDKQAVMKELDEVVKNLKPLEPCDGCGGFDSSLFLHLRRHWEVNARPHQYVGWFLTRFRKTAEAVKDLVESRVQKLQPDWNCFVKTLMPSDVEMCKTKKTAALFPSSRASVVMEPKNKARLHSINRKPIHKKKRPLDSVDMVSEQHRIHMRSRFNARERDMLILVRAIGFFLNPVYRFWLDPAVLRDIMHEYVPESRTKTVQSLMAAGVREMVRPNRLAYLQRIVRSLSTFEEMRVLRFKLMNLTLSSSQAKTEFFRNAFKVANRLLFMDHQNLPHYSVSNDMFEQFIIDEKVTISSEHATVTSTVLRSRQPECLGHIHHCVTVNAIMSMLIHPDDEEGGSLSNKILDQISATVVCKALELLRADGLVAKPRPNDQQVSLVKSNYVLSFYFRHFFSHRFHPDLVDETTRELTEMENSRQLGHPHTLVGDHAGLVLVASTIFENGSDLEIQVDEEVMSIFELAALEQAEKTTKQIRYLENADLRLEEMMVSIYPKSAPVNVPSIDELITCLDKCKKQSKLTAMSFSAYLRQMVASPQTKSKFKSVYTVIEESQAFGASCTDVENGTGLSRSVALNIISQLTDENQIIEVGVDVPRWITVDYRAAWCLTVDDNVFFPRPWTLLSGSLCKSTIRWMAESILMTVVANPGIKTKDVCFRYEFALQPTAIMELLGMLEKGGCLEIVDQFFENMELSSPFAVSVPQISIQYLKPHVCAIERFSRIFKGVPVLSFATSGHSTNMMAQAAAPIQNPLVEPEPVPTSALHLNEFELQNSERIP